MPTLRALLVAALVLTLLIVQSASLPREPQLTPAASYLPRLVVQGNAPAAAMLARHDSLAPYGTYRSVGAGIRPDDRFRAGSITKTFVATVVLQLAGKDELRLSDTIDAHLPGLVRGHGNDGRRITLRSLLTHTSGLNDYTSALPAGDPAVSGGTGPSAQLGLIVERVTGHSYATEIRRRILAPLHLDSTSLPGARAALPAPHSHGYHRSPDDGTLRDVTAIDPRIAGAAEELISTLADLNRFYAALLSGHLLAPAQLTALLNTRTAQGEYGMGLYPQLLSCGVTVWGHDGRILGSYARTVATRDGSHVLTLRVNTDATPAAAQETSLLEAEFCSRRLRTAPSSAPRP